MSLAARFFEALQQEVVKRKKTNRGTQRQLYFARVRGYPSGSSSSSSSWQGRPWKKDTDGDQNDGWNNKNWWDWQDWW